MCYKYLREMQQQSQCKLNRSRGQSISNWNFLTKKDNLYALMSDKKLWNWNGCCILTHVTQREAVACFDHEKYFQIGHTSMCNPKFDIMVLILLISFCVWGPGSGAIFTHWTDQDQIVLLLDNRATRCQFPFAYT